MPGIPEVKKKPFYKKNAFVEFLGIVGALVAACGTLPLIIFTIWFPVETTTKVDQGFAWVSLVGVLSLVIGSIIKFLLARDKDIKESDEARLDGLHAVLHVVHSLVRHKYGFSRNEFGRLRVTMHRVIQNGHDPLIEQMFDYIGSDEVGKAGRRFSGRPGIVGRAIREKETFAVTRSSTDHAAFISEMVREWGYDRAEAQKLTFDRNSWMAVPIIYKGTEVTGVVYLDSSDEGIFDLGVREAVTFACSGLAVFISERY